MSPRVPPHRLSVLPVPVERTPGAAEQPRPPAPALSAAPRCPCARGAAPRSCRAAASPSCRGSPPARGAGHTGTDTASLRPAGTQDLQRHNLARPGSVECPWVALSSVIAGLQHHPVLLRAPLGFREQTPAPRAASALPCSLLTSTEPRAWPEQLAVCSQHLVSVVPGRGGAELQGGSRRSPTWVGSGSHVCSPK